ncbi:hypothetical protein, partial [uncultured Tateyamaria sp.]|uniref:hypothetical protein n=1 Tax=uncultured Tateyamaria sp. TaxID=455651 RepID=UPI00262945EC
WRKANAGSNKRSNHRASQGEFFNNISPKRTMLRTVRMSGHACSTALVPFQMASLNPSGFAGQYTD